MKTKASELLDKELESGIQNLSHVQPGTDEASKATEDVAKLYRLKLEEERLKEESKATWVKVAVDVGKVIVQSFVYGRLIRAILKYEETGSICAKGSNMVLTNFKLPKL